MSAEAFSGGEEPTDAFLSDLGLLKFGAVSPWDSLEGRFNTEVVDLTGASAGAVEVKFNTTPCPNVL